MIKKYFEYIVEPLKWIWLKYKNISGPNDNFMEFMMIKVGALFFFIPFFYLFFVIGLAPYVFITNRVKELTGFDSDRSNSSVYIISIIGVLTIVISYSLGVRTTRHWGRKIKKKCDEDLKKQGEKMDLKLQKEAEARKEKNG